MRVVGYWGWALLAAACPAAHGQDDAALRRTVVKVFCSGNRVSLNSPWKRDGGQSVSGSGIWLGARRVLTNEHVVDYATQVSVQPYESAERIPADVVTASPEMDLAIIELESDAAFAGLKPPTFSPGLPKLRSTVRVYGFPDGGSSLSVTEGIVSR